MSIVMKREVHTIVKGIPTMEGAGVKLKRVFGYHHVPLFDPFLLFDHFGSENPEDYIKGFPWHPHRGIETVTYMLAGQVEHGDSIGNSGVINSGDIQWMTGGSGIIHQEMPQRYNGTMRGFQLWVNLPKKQKMMEPRYRGILQKDVPVVTQNDAEIKIIAGEIEGTQGPVQDLIVDVEYYDITLPDNSAYSTITKKEDTLFAYVVDGAGYFQDNLVESGHCVLFGKGDRLSVTSKLPLRFLLVAGEPLHEPVAWGGPIVMNSEEELKQAFRELDEGTFIKQHTSISPSRDFYQE
jgi:redox-sensitive bicupin YhaK (pirin superfamily)